jgi:hypothetical protein
MVMCSIMVMKKKKKKTDAYNFTLHRYGCIEV